MALQITLSQRIYITKEHQCSVNLRPLYIGSRPILGLTIGAVIGVLMVPNKSIFRSVIEHPQNNKPLMTSPCLTCSSVSHNQGNGQIGPKRD